MAEPFQCKNCEKLSDASFNFCPHCGQETSNKLTVGVLFSNTIKNYFSVDARFFKSFIPLILKPGVLARRFVDGKRLLYLHPAQFYLFISIIFFFIFSFTIRDAETKVATSLEKGFFVESTNDQSHDKTNSVGIDSIIEGLKDTESASVTVSGFQKKEILDSLIANGASEAEKLRAMGKKKDAGVFTTKVYTQILKLYERKGGGVIETLYDTVPIAMFFMLPLFAFLLKLFFRKRGTFAHHMVFSFYFFTFLFIIFSAIAIANTFLVIPNWLSLMVFLSCIVYLMLALHHFYQSQWLASFLKANFISLIYLLIVVPIALVGVVFVSFLLY